MVLLANSGVGLTYQLKKGNAIIPPATFQNYTATTAGTYRVIVTDATICSKTSAGTTVVTVSCKEGENQQSGIEESVFDMKVYPNPAHDEITFSLYAEADAIYALRVINVTGQVVVSETKDAVEGENTCQINMKDLASGLYMVVFQSGETKLQTQLVKD